MFRLFKPDPSGYVLGKDKWFWIIIVFMMLAAVVQISWAYDFVTGFKSGFADIQDTLGYTEGCDEGVYDYWEIPKVFWRFGYEVGMGSGAVDYYKQIRKDLKNGYRHGAYLGNKSFEN